MAGGAPGGGGGRARGGKFKKPARGGGKHFSRDLRPLDADGNEISMWADNAEKKDGSDEDSSSEEEDSDSDSDGNAGPSFKATPAEELSREERRKEKKARKDAAIARAKAAAVQVGDLPPSDDEEEEEEDDADMPANPNHSKAGRKLIASAAKPDVDEATAGISKLAVKNQPPQSRRERETLEAAAAKERYMKLHEAGKTDEAKADMERLKKIREEREAAAARRKAEEEERKDQESAKRKEIEAKEAKKREAALGKPAGKKSGKAKK